MKIKLTATILTISTMIFALISGQTLAIETAPRITDREIIKSLGDLKSDIGGIKSDIKVLKSEIGGIKSDIKVLKTEIGGIKLEIGDLKSDIKVLKFGQEAINQRFDDLIAQNNQRFDGVNQNFNTLWTMMAMVLAAIFGLIGFIVWDRRTAMKPFEQKLVQVEQNLIKIEKDLEHDLELNSPEGSKLTRMIHAFRELAVKDKEVAVVLRNFSLL